MRGIFHWIMKIKRVIGRRNQSLMALIFCLFISGSPEYSAEPILIIICLHIFLCTFISILITPFSPRFPWNKNISTALSFSLSWLLLLAVLWERSLPIFLPDHDPTRILWKKASPLLPLCPLRVKTGGLVFRRRAHSLHEMLP